MDNKECRRKLRMNISSAVLCTEARNEDERTCNVSILNHIAQLLPDYPVANMFTWVFFHNVFWLNRSFRLIVTLKLPYSTVFLSKYFFYWSKTVYSSQRCSEILNMSLIVWVLGYIPEHIAVKALGSGP